MSDTELEHLQNSQPESTLPKESSDDGVIEEKPVVEAQPLKRQKTTGQEQKKTMIRRQITGSSNGYGKPKEKAGRWTEDEHERFINALRKYGKDWGMIQREVKTRKITNIRAHGQKFLLKLVKDMEENDESTKIHKDSKYFHQIL